MARLSFHLFTRCGWRSLLLAAVWSSHCLATTISTQWGGLTESIAGAIESYASTHAGDLPPDIDSLFAGSTKALLEEQLRGPISSKVHYFAGNLPSLNDGKTLLLATIGFPIEEDRRNSVGRYIVFKAPDGRIRSRWEAETEIQAAVARANLVIPHAAIYREKPLKVLDPDYGARLIEQAVLKHGVPIEQAVKTVEKHVDDVSNRRAKEVTTWAQIASAVRPAETTPEPSTPDQTPKPNASPLPSTPVAQTPAVTAEHTALVWPWLVGILAILVVVALVLKRCA